MVAYIPLKRPNTLPPTQSSIYGENNDSFKVRNSHPLLLLKPDDWLLGLVDTSL